MFNSNLVSSQLINTFQQIVRNMLSLTPTSKSGKGDSREDFGASGTSCSCSMALWISVVVIALLRRGGVGGGMIPAETLLPGEVDCEPSTPESRIEERRFGGMEGIFWDPDSAVIFPVLRRARRMDIEVFREQW